MGFLSSERKGWPDWTVKEGSRSTYGDGAPPAQLAQERSGSMDFNEIENAKRLLT